MSRYREALRHRDFRLLWIGATVSTLGDGMTLVALIWLVYERTGSAIDIGWLTFFYTAPVVVGGLLAGVLLDRFDRRAVLALDTAARGIVMASVPLVALTGDVPTWFLFAVAAVYGLLKMVPLAGVPAMIPALVPAEHLTTANALESISFGVGGIIGPAIAGVLVALVGAPLVIGLDAVSYFGFLVALLLMRGPTSAATAPAPVRRSIGLGPAIRVFLTSPAILATTLMFMAFNVGEGVFMVVLPIYAVDILRQDAAAYGSLLAAFSAGLLLGAVAVGAVATPIRIGRAIAMCQTVAGVVLLGFLAGPGLPLALGIGVLFGLVSSPLTVWAQTIRMRIVAPELRGRVFALLRTMMQSTPPLGGLIAGFVIAGPGLAAALLIGGAVIAIPGIVGVLVPALNEEHTGGTAATAAPAAAER